MYTTIEPLAPDKQSVLIVDDSPADRELFHELVTRCTPTQYTTILQAGSCESALALVENHTPTCCLVDYKLPKQSGLDFLKEVRRQKNENIPIILMTGEGNEQTAVEIMRSGAQDYLVKSDITLEKLKHSIATAIHTCDVQNQLEYLAHYDTLTGLLNRRLFMDRLQTAINTSHRYQQRCSLLYIDVDNFKHINDCYGHFAGDLVLKAVGKRIKNSCRVTDSSARLGGDEFGVLLERIDEEDTNLIAEKILLSASSPVALEDQSIQVSLSIGVAHYPKTAQSTQELLKQADEAMYRAKQSGKANCFRFSQEHKQEWERRQQLESLLPAAIKNNELQLVYQPIVNAADKSLHSLEVLTRWHPDGLSISATDLIAMIERLKLFDSFHTWLVDAAFAQYDRWQAVSGNVQFCLNIPANHADSDWLVQCLHRAFKQHNVSPLQVALEITETTLMSNVDLGSELLTVLQKEGVNIAIDDFGTGYSSMSYLTTLPLNILKIDQKFIQQMESDKRSRKVVEATTALGHSLGLQVVAEGIETQKQYQMAKDIGCDLLQGYYFGRPGCAVEQWGDFMGKYPSVMSCTK